MVAKLYAVTELLEDILLHLPLKDLLLSQRVNKHFKATIDGSLKLQRALFFSPAPQIPSGSVISDNTIRFNTLLLRAERCAWKDDHTYRECLETCAASD